MELRRGGRYPILKSAYRQADVSDVEEPKLAVTLFSSTAAAWMWLLLRLWLGWSWLDAGYQKITDPAWISTGTAIQGFWQWAAAIPAAPAKPVITYDWYRSFIQMLLDTNSYVWSGKLVAMGETLIGIGLIVGAFVGVAAFFGGFMNLNLMLAGTAATNPIELLVAVPLVLAWKVAGYYGLDRWILPALGTPWYKGWLVGGAVRQPPLAPSAPA